MLTHFCYLVLILATTASAYDEGGNSATVTKDVSTQAAISADRGANANDNVIINLTEISNLGAPGRIRRGGSNGRGSRTRSVIHADRHENKSGRFVGTRSRSNYRGGSRTVKYRGSNGHSHQRTRYTPNRYSSRYRSPRRSSNYGR